MKKLAWVGVFAALGCGGGGTANMDAGIPPAAAAAAVSFAQTAAIAAALGAPLADEGELLHRDLAATDDMARTRAQDGFSGMSVVTPATCATFTWAGLSATITMTGCTLEATGQPISGILTLAIEPRQTRFTMTFTALTIGDASVDGTVALTIGGPDLGIMRSLDADLTFTVAGATTMLHLAGVNVQAGAAGITLDGTAMVASGGVSATVQMSGLTWAMGDCLPSSGNAGVSVPGVPTMAITFLPTTPNDGIVQVQVPPLPAVMQMLFMACPP